MSLRILVVEDQLDLSQVWADFLRHLGHQVTVTASLQETMSSLAAGLQPEVAVVDWTLSDGSAEPVLDALRAEHPKCLVAVTTGHGQEVAEATKDRAAAILRKPFSLRDLAKLVASAPS